MHFARENDHKHKYKLNILYLKIWNVSKLYVQVKCRVFDHSYKNAAPQHSSEDCDECVKCADYYSHWLITSNPY